MTVLSLCYAVALGGMAVLAMAVTGFARSRRQPYFYILALANLFGAFYELFNLLTLVEVPESLNYWLMLMGYLTPAVYLGALFEFLNRFCTLPATRWESALGFWAPRILIGVCWIPNLVFSASEVRRYTVGSAPFTAASPGPLSVVAVIGFGAILTALLSLTFRNARTQGWALFVTLLLLGAGSAVDGANSVGWTDLPFVGGVGAVPVSMILSFRLATDWGDEASRLVALRASLEREVGQRSEALTEARRELAHRDRMAIVGRMSAAVGHEINNPLTYIISNLQLLKDAPDHGERDELVAESLEGAERIAHIVRELRQLSYRQAEAEDVKLVDAIDAAVRTLRHRLTKHRRIEHHVPDDIWVYGEATGLSQIFVNLFSNALNAMTEEGEDVRHEIVVRCDAQGDEVLVSVTDDGHGMTPAHAAKLFEPFRSNTPRGLGLGMFVVRNLVDAFHGAIRVASTSPSGTTIALTLRRRPAPAPVSVPEPDGSSLSGVRVLVVDDQPEVARAVRRLLTGAADTSCVFSAFAAEAAMQKTAFGLVLCDVMMPGRSGIELCLRARGRMKNCPPFIFMTGGTNEDGLRAKLEALGAPILYKPFLRKDMEQAWSACATNHPLTARAASA